VTSPPQQPEGPDPRWPEIEGRTQAAEEDAAHALSRDEAPLAHQDLLRFYDRLRERVLHGLERHGGRVPEAAAEALLLVPDIFILLVRLGLDKEVPGKARALIWGTIGYFILPTDLLPEAIFGVVGYLDDLVLAAVVLTQVFGGDLEPYARRHWSGQHDLMPTLRRITDSAEDWLGGRLHGRLRRLLRKRGLPLDEP